MNKVRLVLFYRGTCLKVFFLRFLSQRHLLSSFQAPFYSQLSWSYLSSDWSVQFLGAWSLFLNNFSFLLLPSHVLYLKRKWFFRFIRGHPKGICPFNNSRIVLFLLGWHSKVFWSSISFYARVVVFCFNKTLVLCTCVLTRRVSILLLIRKVLQLLWSCYLFIRLIF